MAKTDPLIMLTRCLKAIDLNNHLPVNPKTVKNGAVRPISAAQQTHYNMLRSAVAAGNTQATQSLKAHTARYTAPIKQLANEYKRQLHDRNFDVYEGANGKVCAVNRLTNMVIKLN